MFSLHTLGPYWAVRASAPPLPTPSGLPVFQTLNFYSTGLTFYNLNTVETYDPFNDDHSEAFRMDPLDVNQGATPYVGDDGKILYDPKSDMVFAVTSEVTSDQVIYCVDTRASSVVWQQSFGGNSYTAVELIGVAPTYVWLKARNPGGDFIFFSYNVSTGAPVHTIVIPDSVPLNDGMLLSTLWNGWRLALSDTKICVGQYYSAGTGQYSIVTLDVTSPTAGTLNLVNINGIQTTDGYYPDTIWAFYDGKAYIANYVTGSQPNIPLFQVIDLSTMSITNIPHPFDTSVGGNQVYVMQMFLNEDKTRAYFADQGDVYTRCLEFDITTPTWTYLGQYGGFNIEEGTGEQSEHYYYANGMIFGANYDGAAYAIWPVGTYSYDAPYISSGWYGYRNYDLFNYNLSRQYNPWNVYAEAQYTPGKCTGVWLLPSPQRPYTPPSYSTTPPTVTAALVDGVNNLTHVQPVQWYSYNFTGLDSIQFALSGAFGLQLVIFDSEGRAVTYRESSNATITRSLSLPGVYYIGVYPPQAYTFQLRGTDGWSAYTADTTPLGAFTITVTPGVTEG